MQNKNKTFILSYLILSSIVRVYTKSIQCIYNFKLRKQKGESGNGFLTDVEVNRFIELRNQLNPNLPQERLLTTVREPVDIDGASAQPNPMSMEELNQFLENIYRARIPRESYPQPIKPSKPFNY